MKKIIFAFLFLVFATGLVSLAAEKNENFRQAPESALKLKNPLKPEDPEVLAVGAKLFSTNCASCHGDNAMGSGNVPALAKGPAQTASDGELFWFITHGSIKNGMPAFKIPEQQRWQIISFIKSLKGSKAVAESKNSSKEKLENFPPPKAPFTDYRYEKPGQVHKILVKDLPAPAPETSVGNGPKVVIRPAGAWPQVPAGFKVQLFAENLDNPRLLRTAPNGDIFLAESSSGKIRVFRGVTSDGKAEKSEVFATGLNQPYGITFYPPGKNPQWLYVGNTDAVIRFAYHSGDLKASGEPQKIAPLPFGGGHWTRDLQFSNDGKKLFVAVGSASNVDDSDTSPAEKNRADILVMSPDGKDMQVYASGIRNAGGGLTIQPSTGTLWCSANERDALGDNLVPDYITHVTEGGFYGWPWWYMGDHQDPRHEGKHPELKSKVLVPDVLLQPHHASLQLAFYNAKQFPSEYRGDIFSSQHGSWNRTVRTGYELIRVPLHGTNKASGEYEDFMTGFVTENGNVWGRPVGVTIAADGSLLVSDDGSNSIWRVIYTGK